MLASTFDCDEQLYLLNGTKFDYVTIIWVYTVIYESEYFMDKYTFLINE